MVFVAALSLAACGRRTIPRNDAGAGVRLHVEHAPGVPVIDIRDNADAGTTRIQIGGAGTTIPNREPEPPDVPY